MRHLPFPWGLNAFPTHHNAFTITNKTTVRVAYSIFKLSKCYLCANRLQYKLSDIYYVFMKIASVVNWNQLLRSGGQVTAWRGLFTSGSCWRELKPAGSHEYFCSSQIVKFIWKFSLGVICCITLNKTIISQSLVIGIFHCCSVLFWIVIHPVRTWSFDFTLRKRKSVLFMLSTQVSFHVSANTSAHKLKQGKLSFSPSCR